MQWTVTVYLLAISVLLLSFGRAGDLWGHKRVYLSGFWLFVIGSALCGMSPGVATLIAFRGVQAIGAAMLFASSPALLTIALSGEPARPGARLAGDDDVPRPGRSGRRWAAG